MLKRYAGAMPHAERIPHEESKRTVKQGAGNPFTEPKKESAKPPSTPREDIFASIKRITPDVYAPRKWISKTRKEIPEIAAPRPIGKGGEHLVFEFPDPKHSDVVMKVNFHQTLPVLRAYTQGEIERKKARENMEEAMVERRSQLHELREDFGHAAVPVQRFLIQDVPVSRDVVERLYPGWLSERTAVPSTLPAWVAFQRRLEFDPEKTVSLTGYYPEQRNRREERTEEFDNVYDVGHDILIGKETDLDPEEQRNIVLDMYPGLQKVGEKADSDPGFTEKLQETVRKLISYTETTMTALDLAGKNNVVLMQGEKGWELKMPDALPVEDLALDDLQHASNALQRGGHLTEKDASTPLNVLNTVRVINALALLAGVPERLRVDGLDAVPASTWRKEFAAALLG